MLLILTGCSRYAGSISGSKAIPGTKLLNCFVFQFDKYEGEYNESERRPLFAIVWQAHSAGSKGSDSRNMTTSIHEHSIAPSRVKKAVYALQPDYSLKELSLTEDEIDRLFSLVRDTDDLAPILASDEAWQQKVQPNLKVVERPQEESR